PIRVRKADAVEDHAKRQIAPTARHVGKTPNSALSLLNDIHAIPREGVSVGVAKSRGGGGGSSVEAKTRDVTVRDEFKSESDGNYSTEGAVCGNLKGVVKPNDVGGAGGTKTRCKGASVASKTPDLLVQDVSKPMGDDNSSIEGTVREAVVGDNGVGGVVADIPYEPDCANSSSETGNGVRNHHEQDGVQLLPIKDLKAGMPSPWAFVGRVYARNPIRNWKTFHDAGSLLEMYVADSAKDSIRVTLFNDAVDRYKNVVTPAST
ncbi:hypothetical protein F444_11534, partial [Phytophthora nicotianae P1976]